MGGGGWVKTKCLNREEFIVVGWTDPEGARQAFGSLLLGYSGVARSRRAAGRPAAPQIAEINADKEMSAPH